VPTKSLDSRDPKLLENARTLVRRFIDREFDGNVLRASQRMKVSQSQLHQFLAGSKGVGMGTLVSIAEYMHVTLDTLLGRQAQQKQGQSIERQVFPLPRLLPAIDVARDSGIEETFLAEFVREVIQQPDPDFNAVEWLQTIQARYAAWSRERKASSRVATEG
jgi:transcriptional regulator with XRE-family HTH domain